jgi:hypothetical protein
MRKSVSCLFAAAIMAVSFSQGLPACAQSKDEQEIHALQDRLAAAVRARDLDAVMKEYIPGNELFVFDSDLPRQHIGWESYKKDWGGSPRLGSGHEGRRRGPGHNGSGRGRL